MLLPLSPLNLQRLTRMFKAIIVEDSRLARLELKSQLAKITNISLVAEAENIEQASQLFTQHTPDLLFLDINLPDGNGLDFLASLTPAPKVIFITAFEQYALQAFEQNAVDYLLKPFTLERLQDACHKLFDDNVEPSNHQENELMALDSRFFVKDGQKCWLIQLAQVEQFQSMSNYTQVHFEQQKPLVYRTLAQIEARLPQDKFFRINRSHIVQLSYITDVALCASGSLELTLKSGAIVEVSRRQTSQFKALFSL